MLRNHTPNARPRAVHWLVGLLGLSATGLLLGAADEPVFVLPKYTVTGTPDLPPPEAWRYAEFPGFTVLSNASDIRTRQLLGNFEMFRHAVGLVWPLPDKTSVPVSIIVCGARNSFAGFVPKEGRNRPVDPVSFLLCDAEHAAIIVDGQTTGLFATEATGDPRADARGFDLEAEKLLGREYIRFLLRRMPGRTPVWMEEGMIQILLAMKITREQVVYGRVEDPNTLDSGETTAGDDLPDIVKPPIEDRDFNFVFKTRGLLPLADFFAVTRDSPEAGRIYGDNRWVKQAYAFVHMCLFGRGGRYQKSFAAFLARATREPVTETMFKECFAMDYAQMRSELQIYVGFTDYQSREFNSKKGKELPAPTPLVFRDAEEFESARIKGDALLLGGNLELAEAALLPAYLRGSRDPGLLATLGLYEQAAGHGDRARRFLEAAVAGQVVRPEAYLELARLRYTGALARSAGADRLSAGEVTGITSLLYVARHQPPHIPELYELLAETWRHSATKPAREDVLVLIQGATLFPERLDYVAQAAAFALDAGIDDAARPMIGHGLKNAADPGTKTRFEQLQAALPPAGR